MSKKKVNIQPCGLFATYNNWSALEDYVMDLRSPEASITMGLVLNYFATHYDIYEKETKDEQ